MNVFVEMTRTNSLKCTPDQNYNQPPDFYDSDGEDSEDEHDLRFVSSDVEMDPEELDSDAR